MRQEWKKSLVDQDVQHIVVKHADENKSTPKEQKSEPLEKELKIIEDKLSERINSLENSV